MADPPSRGRAARRGAPDRRRASAGGDLPLLLDERDVRAGEAPQLRLGEVAGTGRMAIVREAMQLPLRRRVAVKIPHLEGDAASLIAEARIAGALEHPNIVPIHMLGRDREGRPLLVMKLIEGEPWREQLAEPDRPERLRHHLGILLQVCNAVGLAHGRDVIHRDLKPANVMIGPFGEVYVVDWGLAVDVRDAASAGAGARDVRGTAAFMAPEMLRGARLGPASDIYQLGGILHVILSGSAPFEGVPLAQRLADPMARLPRRIRPEVPPELAAICLRALSTNPNDRHASVHAFREAIADALRHLGSLEVSAAAEARLRSLRDADADDASIQELIIEARFGFQQALVSWPGNEQARRGLQATLELACDREIQRENATAAAMVLAALPEPNPELAARLATLEETLAARRDKIRVLEELEHHVDIGVDAPARRKAAAALGGTALFGLCAFALGRSGGVPLGYGTAIALVVGTIAAAATIAQLWFRTTNVANRRSYRAAVVGLAGAALMLALGWYGGMPLAHTGVLTTVTLATALVTTAFSLGLRLQPAALTTYALAAALTVVDVGRPWLLLVGGAATLGAILWGLSQAMEASEDDDSTSALDELEPAPLVGPVATRTTPPPPEPRLTADDVATWRNEPNMLSPNDIATRRAADERHTVALPVSIGHAIARHELPTIAFDGASDDVRQLELGPEAGSGGMGTVYEATQLPLGRRVAVKVPNDDAEASAALFHEALVAGVLDHPNVVPIHVLGRDERNRPLLVMKYVEGKPWLLELCLPDRLERLDHHLDVLMQVCHAVGYAHHRGILHRDLKATNVMVGAFGEVQVLDWGLAVAIDDEHVGRLPMSRDLCEVEGTPSYMAPEMIVVDQAAIGPATDVYLLGGLLHYILLGRPPHRGSALTERMNAPYEPVALEAPDVPAELVAICARALDPDPTRRFASAAAMREAIADYRQHASSGALATKAAERSRALAELLEGPREAATAARAHQLTTEARFGFREALRAWPDNPRARAGLQRVLELACRYALERRDHDEATSLLAALPDPHPELTARVDTLGRELAEQSDRVRDLEELERGVDLAVNKRSRARGSILLGLVTVGCIGALTIARLTGVHEPGHLDAIVVVALAAGANWHIQRTREDTNEINLRIHRVLEATLFSAVAHLTICWFLGVDLTLSLALMMAAFATSAMLATVTISWLVAPAVVTLLPTAIALAVWPTYRPWLLIGGLAATFGGLALGARSIEGEDSTATSRADDEL